LAEELPMNTEKRELETTPLISKRRQESRQSLHDDSFELSEKAKANEFPAISSYLVLALAELPTFIIVIQGSDQLCSLVGIKRYQVILGCLVVVTSILNHFDEGEKLVTFRETGNARQVPEDWLYVNLEMKAGSHVGILLGLLAGVFGFIMSELDIWFSIAVSISTAAATFLSRLCKVFCMLLYQKQNPTHSQRIIWTRAVMAGCQDFICCLVILQLTRVLFTLRPIQTAEDDLC